MMISDAIQAKLNDQIMAELRAAHSYLAMACAFEQMGLKILAKLFFQQHDEEYAHAKKFVHYVLEVGGSVMLEAVGKPEGKYKNAQAIVETALHGEKEVTRMINELVALADSEKDYATRSFLNWFVDEQVEEVSSMTDLLNLVKLAGDNMLQVENRVRHDMMTEN